MNTLQELEELYPSVEWREPQPIRLMSKNGVSPTGVRFVCRVCVANYGIKPDDVELLPVDRTIVLEHIAREHDAR